jgi:mannose-6-phosphate isomerase-like protein (cupin superfamily)
MKIFTLAVLGTAALFAATTGAIDEYSPKDLNAIEANLAAKHTMFASKDLKRYGNHYTMLAYREGTGSSEVHEHDADIFVIQDGAGTLLTGGTMVNPHTEKPGELRGSSISGGERHQFGPGTVFHIPAGTPHQMLVDKGKPVSYFVVKVTGQ